MVDWVRRNGLNFAVRCGPFVCKGLSQSSDVAIDVRGLNRIVVDKAAGLVTKLASRRRAGRRPARVPWLPARRQGDPPPALTLG